MSGTVLPTPTAQSQAPPALDVGVDLEGLTAEETIAWALERFGDDLRFAVSFQ